MSDPLAYARLGVRSTSYSTSDNMALDWSKTNNPSHACWISFVSSDTLMLTNFSPELLFRFQAMISRSWHRGIQHMTLYNYGTKAHSVKLFGNPWGSGSFTKTARLLVGLSRFMVSEGWALELSMFTGRCCDYGPHNIWIFARAKEQVTLSKLQAPMCCMAFGRVDKIRVVDGGPEVLGAVLSCIDHNWQKRVQRHKSYKEMEEFKLRGRPWARDYFEGAVLLSRLVNALKNVGCEACGTVDFRCNIGGVRWILQKCADGVTDST